MDKEYHAKRAEQYASEVAALEEVLSGAVEDILTFKTLIKLVEMYKEAQENYEYYKKQVDLDKKTEVF